MPIARSTVYGLRTAPRWAPGGAGRSCPPWPVLRPLLEGIASLRLEAAVSPHDKLAHAQLGLIQQGVTLFGQGRATFEEGQRFGQRQVPRFQAPDLSLIHISEPT